MNDTKHTVPTHDLEGNPAFILRSQLIRMCSTFEVSSFLKAAKQGDHTGLVDTAEKGFKGFDNFSDRDLVKQWEDISSEYVRMRDNGDLIHEDEMDFEVVDFPELLENHALSKALMEQSIEIDTVPFKISDSQPEGERDPSAPKVVEGEAELTKHLAGFIFYDPAHPGKMDKAREFYVEVENNTLCAMICGPDDGAPAKIYVPTDGPITVDMVEYNADHQDLLENPGRGV